jgi:CelD/BcsL family acetyltransferase involved in cellulose biosynthesis
VAVDVYDDIEALAPEWDELADRVGASPFQRPGWVAPWWRAFGDGAPEILGVRDGTRLRGVLALYRRRGVVRTMGDDHAVECGLLAEDSTAAEALATSLIDMVGHRGSLLFVDPTRRGLAELRERAAAAGRPLMIRTMARPPYVAMVDDWESYEQARDARLRSDLRRRRRRLEEEGHVTVELHCPEPGEIEGFLTEGFAVEASGWKATGRTAISSRPATERFYRDAAAWAAGRGLLHLAFLRVNGRPLAFEYAVRDGSTHYRVKVGFEADAGRFAPGKLLLAEVMEDAFAAGLARFDFLGDQDPYKLEWATGLRDLVLVQLFARSVRGRTARAALALGVPAARRAAAVVRRR